MAGAEKCVIVSDCTRYNCRLMKHKLEQVKVINVVITAIGKDRMAFRIEKDEDAETVGFKCLVTAKPDYFQAPLCHKYDFGFHCHRHGFFFNARFDDTDKIRDQFDSWLSTCCNVPYCVGASEAEDNQGKSDREEAENQEVKDNSTSAPSLSTEIPDTQQDLTFG